MNQTQKIVQIVFTLIVVFVIVMIITTNKIEAEHKVELDGQKEYHEKIVDMVAYQTGTTIYEVEMFDNKDVEHYKTLYITEIAFPRGSMATFEIMESRGKEKARLLNRDNSAPTSYEIKTLTDEQLLDIYEQKIRTSEKVPFLMKIEEGQIVYYW